MKTQLKNKNKNKKKHHRHQQQQRQRKARKKVDFFRFVPRPRGPRRVVYDASAAGATCGWMHAGVAVGACPRAERWRAFWKIHTSFRRFLYDIFLRRTVLIRLKGSAPARRILPPLAAAADAGRPERYRWFIGGLGATSIGSLTRKKIE